VLGGPIPFTDEVLNKPRHALPNSKIKR
jgi:hypothetical protein